MSSMSSSSGSVMDGHLLHRGARAMNAYAESAGRDAQHSGGIDPAEPVPGREEEGLAGHLVQACKRFSDLTAPHSGDLRRGRRSFDQVDQASSNLPRADLPAPDLPRDVARRDDKPRHRVVQPFDPL